MFKTLTSALALAAISGSMALADDKPWDLPKPAGMTAEHQENAALAREVQERLPLGLFGYDPIQADWSWNRDRNRTIPMSNMTISGLSSHVTGRYHILAAEGGERWAARYYAPDGKTHFCEYSDTLQDYREWTLDRYVATAAFGMAGIFHWDPASEATPKPPEQDSVGWPVVVDGDRGFLFTYIWNGSEWISEPGWIQAEYAAAFQERCPDLPRDSNINNDQLGEAFSDLIRAAVPIRGAQTAFPNDPQDPLTASMYYWFNAPE